jgi:hypothetical protein
MQPLWISSAIRSPRLHGKTGFAGTVAAVVGHPQSSRRARTAGRHRRAGDRNSCRSRGGPRKHTSLFKWTKTTLLTLVQANRPEGSLRSTESASVAFGICISGIRISSLTALDHLQGSSLKIMDDKNMAMAIPLVQKLGLHPPPIVADHRRAQTLQSRRSSDLFSSG